MRATVLWTGGKDSSLAFYKACIAGYDIINLLTFVPRHADFLAHPLYFMKYQAEAIGIPHYEAVVDMPFKNAYEYAIMSFKEKFDIGALITGDIAEVEDQPNWIRQRCAHNDIEVVTPLWGADRHKLFTELLCHGFKTIISCIKKGCLTEEWLGRELDRKALDDLREVSGKTGLDICGEQGEYHTLVVDGPLFKKHIVIGDYSKHASDSLMYIRPHDVTLADEIII